MKISKILASESFLSRGKHYFLDFKIAENNSNYINIVRSDSQPDGSYTRQCVTVFEEDFDLLIGCLSSLFSSAAYPDDREISVQDLRRMNADKGGIKSWEPELRPREKMLQLGREAMENAELLAMLIGSGSPNESALVLAARILDSVGGDLRKLSGVGLEEFCGFAGMGLAKSSAIMAAMELGRRMDALGIYP
ncbi:hypothetical protein SAMN06265348_10647 [Pedobacter westerhofensis]|uniref:UPF0758 domain-containing protein n=1 Tax=Pedobacter westerhofensis TaxID=425512 RepID=A0A521DQG4_9SPHI|nr:UPF0758 domain-containing protein [Pedobacter westerhofensis]SMO73351.1 hypothetical protein SAMN06265348_10647 [Pedobacter westerhofensis]